MFLDIDKRILIKLKQSYPDGNVVKLSKTNNALYREIHERIKDTEYNLTTYLEALGYSHKRRKHSSETILQRLNELYPDKNINGISSLQKKHQNLYIQIRTFASEENQTPTEFLIANGFKIYSKSRTKIKYDVDALKKLKYEFNCNFSELARFLEVSKQNLDGKLSVKRKYPPYWHIQELTNQEEEAIQYMINNRTFFFENEEVTIKIYKHHEQFGRFSILIVYPNKQIKFLDSIPEKIQSSLIHYNYHKFQEVDFDILKEIENSGLIAINPEGDKEVRIDREHKIYNSIQSRCTSLQINRQEYMDLLGFKAVDNRKITHEEIRDILNQYRIDNSNYVHIPFGDPNYQKIASLSSRNEGFSSRKDFYEYYGFKYKRTRITNKKENAIAKIKKHYCIEGNKVFISTYDPFYMQLLTYGRNHGNLGVNDLLIQWGFQRIYKENLPDNYKPFDWQSELKSSSVEELEQYYASILEDLVVEDNLVYIDSTSSLYSRLFILALRKKTSINNLLEEWGFKRTYDKDALTIQDEEEVILNSLSNKEKDEWTHISDLLENIINIQGDLSSSTTVNEKIKRSTSLTREMKRLYFYKCQLCCFENGGFHIPLIEKEDGTNYVEVHHIIPVSEYDEVGDDSYIMLDSYENVVVVCAHHHRYLHFHNGGFSEIVKGIDGDLYFKSEKGESIKIYTNYHLKPRIKAK